MSAYLDGVARQGKILNKEQMQMLEAVVTELFDVTDQYQEQIADEAKQKEAIARIDMCGQTLSEHTLPKGMKDIFQGISAFLWREYEKADTIGISSFKERTA